MPHFQYEVIRTGGPPPNSLCSSNIRGVRDENSMDPSGSACRIDIWCEELPPAATLCEQEINCLTVRSLEWWNLFVTTAEQNTIASDYLTST